MPLPDYYPGGKAVVRWSLTADAENPSARPVVFTRRAYSRSFRANGGGSDLYVSGEWQAIIMPVTLPAD